MFDVLTLSNNYDIQLFYLSDPIQSDVVPPHRDESDPILSSSSQSPQGRKGRHTAEGGEGEGERGGEGGGEGGVMRAAIKCNGNIILLTDMYHSYTNI